MLCLWHWLDTLYLCIESGRWDGRDILLHCYCGSLISMISHTSTKHNGAIDVDYKSIPWHVRRLSHEANFTTLNPRHHDTYSADAQTTLLQSPSCHFEHVLNRLMAIHGNCTIIFICLIKKLRMFLKTGLAIWRYVPFAWELYL